MPVKVQKKDGQLEDFSRVKISAGVMKAGANFEQAEEVARQVEAWVQAVAVNGVVNSAQIRSKVLEVLQRLNPTAAAAFEAYRKPDSSGSEPTPSEIPPMPDEPPSAPPTEMPPETPPTSN